MPVTDSSIIIAQTIKWVTNVVAGNGFCPFVAKEIKRGSIHYEVLAEKETASVLAGVMEILYQLDSNENIETSLLILPGSFDSFDAYLQLIEMAEALLIKEGYEGIYQVASFHPHYLFAGSNEEDPANYTNRSPYPMLHFLREASVSKAVDSYAGIDEVPNRNIEFARKKGLKYMQELLAACMNISE